MLIVIIILEKSTYFLYQLFYCLFLSFRVLSAIDNWFTCFFVRILSDSKDGQLHKDRDVVSLFQTYIPSISELKNV